DKATTVTGAASHTATCSSGPGSHSLAVFGADHYVMHSLFTHSPQGTATFIDSDTISFSKGSLPVGPYPSATGNAAGDLLVVELAGEDLRRYAASGATI